MSAASSPHAVSVVIPTYWEAQNLPLLIDRLSTVRAAERLELEALIMDDDSRDGSREWAVQHGPAWMRFVVRTRDRGLSAAVLEGIHRARHPYVIVMDADLSHPPEKIPEMLRALSKGGTFVIGSRYIPGASTDEAWSWFRWLNSQVATWLARGLTDAKDPMAGFFGFRTEVFERAEELNPIGYKIGLELIVKCGVSQVQEVPIHFADRRHGESKLNFKEQARYFQHLSRLYRYRFTSDRKAA